jgi:hypothetical protein
MNKTTISYVVKPPSLPIAIGTSPTGEGAQANLCPLGGNRKGGKLKLKCKYVNINIIQLHIF